ncbi:MAG: DUF1080 domain-containing protein, partial [Planctomycetota bacterium]
MKSLLSAVALALLAACQSPAPTASASEWTPLFNGRDLDGWIPKITHYPLGEDPLHTFRVQDGLLQVRYDGYENFEGRFGHLFFEAPFENYDLRVVYRFLGEQCPGGPGWAWRNSGVMVHGQDPRTMGEDQDFPVSVEVQTLGSLPGRERSTGNLCTPGTHVSMGGQLHTQHCTDSSSPPKQADAWVELRIEVRGHDTIRHYID